MSQTVELQMLTALEHLYYASRFQHKRFVIYVKAQNIKDILSDLRVLSQAQIQIILLVQDFVSDTVVEGLSDLGLPLVKVATDSAESLTQKADLNLIPLLEIGTDIEAVMQLTLRLEADKLFVLTDSQGLLKNGRLLPFITFQNVKSALNQNQELGIEKGMLQAIIQLAEGSDLEVAFVQAKGGNLFLEIFTHQGQGTLMTTHYLEAVRQAEKRDVMDISLLMRPYIQSGQLLPMAIEEIALEIGNYFVAEINGELVASARLKQQGEAFELCKLCTLPRYQGKGKARELCQAIIAEAHKREGAGIFALSVVEEMSNFFQSLGMQEIERAELPEEWRLGYDLTRPSLAFWLELR